MDHRKEKREWVGDKKADSTPIELAGIVGGIARKVRSARGSPVDGMIAVYQHRFTYTFILEDEVCSIHYDRKRREIFLRGHNVQSMKLTPAQTTALWTMADVLAEDPQGRDFLFEYRTTLASILTDKQYNGNHSTPA